MFFPKLLQCLILYFDLKSIVSLFLCVVLENVLISFSLCSGPVFPELLTEETIYSCYFCHVLIDCVYVYFCAVYPVLSIYISSFVSLPYCFDYCSFVVQSEVREHDSSNFVLSQGYFATHGLLCFHTNFTIICPNSVKDAVGILIGIALNLWIVLDAMVI